MKGWSSVAFSPVDDLAVFIWLMKGWPSVASSQVDDLAVYT